MGMLTKEQFERMNKAEQVNELVNAAEKAQYDDTPYIAIDNDEMHILGNPNKTEIKKHDYEINFAFPNTPEWKSTLEKSGEEIVLETDDYIKVKREFKGVYILPRYATHIFEAFAHVQAFITTVSQQNEETGELEFKLKTEEEVMDMLKTLNTDVERAIYRAVGAFLRLSDIETDCIVLSDAMFNVVKIASDNPDLMNGSNLFFG